MSGAVQPFVSILIPCYNAGSWVGKAIESALAQDYPEKEVIVVDDGSTDGSSDVIASFGKYIRWRRTENRAGGAARNDLLAMSSGDWLQYLDADDYLLPTKISGQVAALERFPEIDVLFGPGILLREVNGEMVTETLEILERDPWVLLARWQLPQTGAPLWRKSAILYVGGWKKDQWMCQEHELYLRLLKAGKRFEYDDASGAIYRRQEGGTLSTRDNMETSRQRLRIVNEVEAHLRAKRLLTPKRQDEINQARFECARIIWLRDRARACRLIEQIEATGAPFTPCGQGVPKAYEVIYRLFGFASAERVADARRRFRDCFNVTS